MHVQLGSWSDRARLTARLGLLLGVHALLAVSCGGPAPRGDVLVSWKMAPASPVAGAPLVAEVTLRDAARRPLTGARLEIQGHMSHPGMAPVLAAAVEEGNGVYQARFELPMAGDWIVLVTGTLPDGRTVSDRFDIAGVRPSG